MEKTNERFHISEGTRNAIIVVAIFSIIAIISYMEWKGRIAH